MQSFEHLPENERQKGHQNSSPGESSVQLDQSQAELHNRSLSSETTEAWMRWEYSPEEWALFERIDWQPVNLAFWLLASLSLLLCSDVGIVIWSSLAGNYPVFALSILLIWVWTLVIVVFTSSVYNYNEARKRHRMRQRQGQSQKVTFDSKGLWEAGAYFPLNDYPFVLKRVSMTSKPPALHFRRTRSSGGKTRPRSATFHIPVPGGHEQEAADLVQRFHSEVIQAREQVWQRLMNRPEPGERES